MSKQDKARKGSKAAKGNQLKVNSETGEITIPKSFRGAPRAVLAIALNDTVQAHNAAAKELAQARNMARNINDILEGTYLRCQALQRVVAAISQASQCAGRNLTVEWELVPDQTITAGQDEPPVTHLVATIPLKGNAELVYSVRPDKNQTVEAHVRSTNPDAKLHPQRVEVDRHGNLTPNGVRAILVSLLLEANPESAPIPKRLTRQFFDDGDNAASDNGAANSLRAMLTELWPPHEGRLVERIFGDDAERD